MCEPVQYHRMLPGKSKGMIITFDDGHDYVVKFLRTGFERVLPNEWIAYCLARYLGLPIPPSRITTISEEFLRQIPDTSDLIYTRRQFAVRFIPNGANLYQVLTVQSLENADSLAGVILLDYWLCNEDRNRNNVLLSSVGEDSYRFLMIDHGDIFGSCNWELGRLGSPSAELYPSATHKWMARFIPDESSFSKFLGVIRTIPRLTLEEIVTMIPDEWGLSAEERCAVVEQLLFRRDKQLAPILRKFLKNVYWTENRR